MKYYCPVITEDNLVLSCDMLRLSFRFDEFTFKKFNSFISDLSCRYVAYSYKIHQNFNHFAYRYLLNFKIYDSSFVVGLMFNGCDKVSQKSCFIEFNPNKTLSNGFVNPILDFIKMYGKSIEIVRCDFAIDIKCKRSLVSLSKDLRDYNKVYKIEKKGIDIDNVTEYLGHRNSNGFVKLYNKTKESCLTYDCTRLEITLDCIDYDNFIKQLPVTYFIKNISLFDTISLNDTDKVLLSLLMQNDNSSMYIKMLGRGKQEKYKKILFDLNSIVKISESDFYSVIRNIRQIIA